MSGSKAPASLTAMETQIRRSEKEVNNLQKQYDELMGQYEARQINRNKETQNTSLDFQRVYDSQTNKIFEEAQNISGPLDLAKQKSEELRRTLENLKLNPEATMEAQNLASRIELAESNLKQSKNEANELAENIKDATKNKFQGFGIDFSSIGDGFEKLGSKIEKFKTKMSRLISTAMVFSLIRSGLTSLSRGFLDLLKSNDNFANSLNQIKVNLMTAFAPIYNYVLPAVNSLMNALSKITGTIATFVSGLFGQTADQAKKNAEELYNQANAQEAVNDAQENLASFDKLNVNNNNDSASSTSGGINFSSASISEVDSGLLDFFNTLKDLLGQIHFDGFITGVQNLWNSLEPFAKNVGDGLYWFIQNVLIPIANWTINDVIPAFFNILAGALDIVNQAIEDVKPLFQWLWENALKPFAEWTGGVIVDSLNGIGNALKWISDNEIAMTVLESLAIAIGLVAGAIAIYNGVMALCNIVTGAFSGIMSVLSSPITLVVLAITALITIIRLCIEHWNEISAAAQACWDWIVSVWEGAKQWFLDTVVQPILDLFGPAFDALINGAQLAWDGIKQVFSNVTGFFGDVFGKAWETVKNVFSTGGKVFDGIKDGIINAFKAVVNALIKGINTIVSTPFNGLNSVLQKIHDISFLGISPFSWLTWRAPVPQIPLLAQGAVIPPNKKFAAVLGDQRNGNNLEAPESLIRKIVREESGDKDVVLNATFILRTDTNEEFGRATLRGLHLLQNVDGKAYVLN